MEWGVRWMCSFYGNFFLLLSPLIITALKMLDMCN